MASMIWAARNGDLRTVQRLVAAGVDPDVPDYDGYVCSHPSCFSWFLLLSLRSRTALHLAATEGHQPIAEFLLAAGVDVSARDRWGYTAYDDAIRAGQTRLADLLLQYYQEKHGKRTFIAPPPAQMQPTNVIQSTPADTVGNTQEQSP